MSSRLAFQTQLASIMEVLANAAVAEICKLVDDDYAVVSLQMSQCQRENKALKRKLHLLELKLARGNAERRLRESAMNSNRARLLVPGDRLRESSPSSGGVFERRMDIALWSGRAPTGEACSESVSIQRKSPDVELVEPEVLVKEEKVEANMSHVEEPEEDIPLIGDDGVVECIPRGPVRQRPSVDLQDTQSTSTSQSRIQVQSSRTRRASSSRGVEKEEEPDVMLVKVEEAANQSQTGLSIQEGVVESSTDDYRAALPFDEITQTSTSQLSELQESGRGLSESGALESPPGTLKDPSSVVAVQLRAPDANTPTNPKTQQQRSSNNNPLTSEYSLFELETFFTRWAPDDDSASARGGPSCPFTAEESAECDQDGVIIVESEPPPVLKPPKDSVQSQPSVSQDTSVSKSRRMQAPSSQPSWNRKAVMIRSADAQLLQHGDMNWMTQQQHSVPSAQTTQPSTTAALSCNTHSDKTSLSGISSTSRTMSSSAAPSVRVSSAALTSVEVAMAAQHRASLNKSHTANIMPSERRRKSYVCRACGKAFSGLSNLEAHERVHTGEKPFRCDTCGKRFSEAGNLKKHHRVHTGEKPFSCDVCGKKFAWICNLRTHQQSATGCGPQAMRRLELGDRTVNAGGVLFTNTEAQRRVFVPK